jgi:hypothetical protein
MLDVENMDESARFSAMCAGMTQKRADSRDYPGRSRDPCTRCLASSGGEVDAMDEEKMSKIDQVRTRTPMESEKG